MTRRARRPRRRAEFSTRDREHSDNSRDIRFVHLGFKPNFPRLPPTQRKEKVMEREDHQLIELWTASTDTQGTPYVARPEDNGFYSVGLSDR